MSGRTSGEGSELNFFILKKYAYIHTHSNRGLKDKG